MEVYRITAGFPKDEKFGLTSQSRRAVVSVPSNIAEGYGRKTTADYLKSLYIAYGSNCELETQIMLTGDFNYIGRDIIAAITDKINEVERMLKALIKSLEEKRLSKIPLSFAGNP